MRLFLLAAAMATVAAVGSARDPLSADALKPAIDADTAFLTKTLEAGSVPKNAVKTVKTAAMLLALAGQQSGNGALQEAALAVATSVAGKDMAAAKTAAGKLAGAKGGEPKKIDLHTQAGFDLDTLMSAYRPTKTGGLNLEKDMKDQGKKVTDVPLAAAVGAQNALIAAYALKFPAAGATGPKLAQWEKLCKEAGELGTAIATEGAKGAKADKDVLQKKLKALELNCSNCHSAFRD